MQTIFDKKLLDLKVSVEDKLSEYFEKLNIISEFNQLKVLNAMQCAKLSDHHFNWATGYGYNDAGREKTEEIYSLVFNTQDAIVRTQIVSGTHALSLSLFGILRPNDTLLSISGKPYDTLEDVIGLKGNNGSSLIELGIKYAEIDLNDGNFDHEKIKNYLENNSVKVIYIQRSGGYSFRKSLTIDKIKNVIDLIKLINKNVIVMVDNCYGEFIETKEPTDVGADLMAGSLIKNPGGGIALTGGYIVGNRDLIKLISYRLTSPGIGKETGLTFGQTRTILQGLFIAPNVVINALKGAIFCSEMFTQLGYEVSPNTFDKRSDIIQAVKLNDENKVIKFCEGIQAASPVDSFVMPKPWDMPGYNSKVIMASGAFVQGSSIELSADAPIIDPYIVYFQGGLTYEHSKHGVLMGIHNIL